MLPPGCLQASGSFNHADSDAELDASMQQGRHEAAAAAESTAQHAHTHIASSSDGRVRPRPRGLPSQVEQTVSRLSSSTAHSQAARSEDAPPAEANAVVRADHSQTGEKEGRTAVQHSDAEDLGQIMAPCTEARQKEDEGMSSYEGSPAKGFLAGQGKPPLSPERRSTALTPKGPSSITAALTGMATPDVNVHCNPLFTEPMGAQNSDDRQQGLAKARHAADTSPEAVTSAADSNHSSSRQLALQSPPSKLQQALRKMMQQHGASL